MISVTAASPQFYKPRAASVDAPGLQTNAKRMAAGLSPLKPRTLFQPSKVVARGPGAPGAPVPAPSPILVTGRLKVNKRESDGSAGMFLGYLAKSFDSSGNDGGSLAVDGTFISTLHATVSFVYSASSGSSLNVALSGVATSYPYLGFAFDGSASPKLTTGNYNLLVATNPTSPGAAASAVGNSLTKQTGPPTRRVPANPNSESAIWSYNPASGRLTASWNNPGGETLTTTKIFYDTASNNVYQGTTSDGPHSISTYEVTIKHSEPDYSSLNLDDDDELDGDAWITDGDAHTGNSVDDLGEVCLIRPASKPDLRPPCESTLPPPLAIRLAAVRGGLLSAATKPLKPWIVVLSALNWLVVVVPASVLRKVFLTADRSRAMSPKEIIKVAFAQSRTRIAAATYLASSLAFLAIHIIMVRTYEAKDSKLTVFVKSKWDIYHFDSDFSERRHRKHPNYLNGRLVFLVISQLVTGFAFALRGCLADQFVFPWMQSVSSKRSSIPMTIAVSLVISSVLATISVSASSLIFGAARTVLPVLYKIPLLPIFLRPFTAHFLRGSWTLVLPLKHFGLLVRAWFIASSTFISWEIADKLFSSVVAEPSPVSNMSQTANLALVSGTTSTDRIFQFYAYSELLELAQDTSAAAIARRADIFGDHKSAVNLWAFLVRESLVLLGKDYQTFLRRGQPLPPPKAAPPPKPVDIRSELATPAPLLRQRVFKAAHAADPRTAALDALASDGPIAQAIDAGADETRVPELFRSVRENVLLRSPIAQETAKTVESAKEIAPRVKGRVETYFHEVKDKYLPLVLRDALETVGTWWNRKRVSKEVELALPFWELDVVVAEVLSFLTSASLEEDRYGVVQRDIPRILEAMVSFLTAIEEYQVEINALANIDPSKTLSRKEQAARDALLIEVQKAQDVLAQTAEGIKRGIARISLTFGDRLQAFKFPTRIARKLQMFIDYS
ncbi:hypothetical protein D9619_010243 [Psilocybe cf. subviscida]|uniref:Uncharacterized protein n=1 Tax=Psilocybe cf. subviscida TaxID=2480587 RepID=A0A8H5ERR0_9AGAR|nr:hypothetical protein D9619_010243 [Psilocybe cf. subviscida]